MIILQEELAQEFRKEVLESFCLLDINFPVPMYLTETDNSLIHDNKTYVSRGFSFDNINSAPGLSVAEIDLLIDNTDKVLSSILMNGDQRGKIVQISLGAAIGGPGAVADGSVKTATRANTKISAVDGSAFVDFSDDFLSLPEHRGCKLTVSDSTGKKLTGYIKAAGTGETYGSELVTNGQDWTGAGGLTPPTGWLSSTGTRQGEMTVINDGGDYTTALQIENNQFNASSPYVTQNIGGQVGVAYRFLVSNKVPLLNAYAAAGTAFGGTNLVFTGIINNGQWVNRSLNFVAVNTSTHITLCSVAGANVSSKAYFDAVSVKQILTPSTTGVTITSTADGSTFNWASKEAGFNYNDASGYTYKLERERSLLVQEFIRGFISSWEFYADNQVRISIKNEAISWAKKTLRIHSSSCPWVFKGTECGYTGAGTWCDRNYARCGELLNTDNYGGFRFLPSIMEREIWWGRQRS